MFVLEMPLSKIYELHEQGKLPKRAEIKKKLHEINADGFERSLFHDFYYTLRNVSGILILAGALYLTRCSNLHWMTMVPIYVFYFVFQSSFLWGSFTLGHDCGHYTCRHDVPNLITMDILGIFHHSVVLLVPYHQWRYSHAKIHHSYTQNIEHDEIFYPVRIGQNVLPMWAIKLVRLTGLPFLYRIYLLFGYSAGREFQHFHWPSLANAYTQQAYENKYWVKLGQISLLASIPTIFLCYVCTMKFGLLAVCLYYLIPLMMHDWWLIMTTYLHHQGEETLWVTEKLWNSTIGGLSCIDRDYFSIFNNINHHINLHQIHHCWPEVPHYKLQKMTRVFRNAFPELVIQDGSNPYVQFFGSLIKFIITSFIFEDTNYWQLHAGSTAEIPNKTHNQ